MKNILNEKVKLILPSSKIIGVVIYQDNNNITLENVTIIRKSEIIKHKMYGVPTCYIKSVEEWE